MSPEWQVDPFQTCQSDLVLLLLLSAAEGGFVQSTTRVTHEMASDQ
jgi:hypothetical protein